MGADPDFAILCAIQAAPLEGATSWARRAGVDAATLRRRLKRLEENGVLRGFAATPSAGAFGRRPVSYQFGGQAPLEDVLAVADVAWAADTYDGRFWVHVYHGGDALRPLEALLGPTVNRYVPADDPGPSVLGRIEFKVLRALIEDPRASVQDLAAATGLSNKTVRNHRAQLIARGHVRIDPLLRPPRTPARLYYHATVELESPRHLPAIRALNECMVISEYNDGRDLYLFLADDGLQEQAERIQAIEALPGVLSVTLVVTRDFGLATERLLRWCDEGIAKWSSASSRAPGGSA